MYPRCLKSLIRRMERAAGAGWARDEQKGEALVPFIARFRLAAEKTDIARHAGLLDFFLLLQESRIAVFTPELGSRRGATCAALASAWNALRLN